MLRKKYDRLIALVLALIMTVGLVANPVMAANGDETVNFTDVPKSQWYYDYVMFLAKRGIVKGYGKTGEFRPANQVIREHAAKMISLSAGLSYKGKKADFPDVDKNGEMSPYIAALVDKGAVQGFPDGTFRPFDNIKRGHAAKMIAIAFDLKDSDLLVELKDLPLSDPLVAKAIETLASNGIVKGYGGSKQFKPDEPINRAELAKMIAIAMVASAIQVAEVDASEEAVAHARELMDQLPKDQDQGSMNFLEDRLVRLEEAGDPDPDPKPDPEPEGPPALIPVNGVEIEGEAEVGSTLQARVSPEDATVIYQWKISEEETGVYVDIPGATSAHYTLLAKDQGRYIRLEIQGTGRYQGTLISLTKGPVAVEYIEDDLAKLRSASILIAESFAEDEDKDLIDALVTVTAHGALLGINQTYYQALIDEILLEGMGRIEGLIQGQLESMILFFESTANAEDFFAFGTFLENLIRLTDNSDEARDEIEGLFKEIKERKLREDITEQDVYTARGLFEDLRATYVQNGGFLRQRTIRPMAMVMSTQGLRSQNAFDGSWFEQTYQEAVDDDLDDLEMKMGDAEESFPEAVMSFAVIRDLELEGIFRVASPLPSQDKEYVLDAFVGRTSLYFDNVHGSYGARAEVTLSVDGGAKEDYEPGREINLTGSTYVFEIQVDSADKTHTENYKVTLNRKDPNLRPYLTFLNIQSVLDGESLIRFDYDTVEAYLQQDLAFETTREKMHVQWDSPPGMVVTGTMKGKEVIDKSYVTFDEGPNLMEITVTSEDDSSIFIKYSIAIERRVSYKALLGRLLVASQAVTFEPSSFYQEVRTKQDEVDFQLDNPFMAGISFSFGEKEHDGTRFTISPQPGDNLVEIHVVAAGDERITNTYVINVIKEGDGLPVIWDLYIHDGERALFISYEVPDRFIEVEVYQDELLIDFLADSRNQAEVFYQDEQLVLVEGGYKVHLLDQVGPHIVTINVSPVEGEKGTYTLELYRLDEGNRTQPEYLSLGFNGEIFQHWGGNGPLAKDIQIDVEIASTFIRWLVPDEATAIGYFDGGEIESGTRIYLEHGRDNVFSLKVTSQSGRVETYTLTLRRELSDRAEIENLIVDGLLHRVEHPKHHYTFLTEMGTSWLLYDNVYQAQIEATFNGEPYYKGEWVDLHDESEGPNIFQLVVTPEDESAPQTYTIQIIRKLSRKTAIGIYMKGLIEAFRVSSDFEGSDYTFKDTIHQDLTLETDRYWTYAVFSSPFGASIDVTFTAPNADPVDFDTNGGEVWFEEVGNYTFDIYIKSAEGSNENHFTITITREPSNQARIEYLNIAEVFMEDPKEGDHDLGETSIKLTSLDFVNAYNASYKIELNDNKDYRKGEPVELNDGTNTFTIRVWAEDDPGQDQDPLVYTYTIERVRSTEPVVQSFSVSDDWYWYPEPDETEWYQTVYNGTVKLDCHNPYNSEVTFTLQEKDYSPGEEISLAVGENKITVLIEAESGEKEKTLTIFLNYEPFSGDGPLEGWEARLTQLSIRALGIDITYPEIEGVIKEDTNRSEVRVEAYPYYSGATVNIFLDDGATPYESGDWIPLQEGLNSIRVEVIGEDATRNDYLIELTRTLSTVALISDLSVYSIMDTGEGDVGEFAFQEMTTRSWTYLEFDNPYGATVDVTYNDSEGRTLVNDEAKSVYLPVGVNTYTIHVKAAGGDDECTYVIEIKRSLSTEAVIDDFSIKDVIHNVDLASYSLLSFDVYEDEIEVDYNDSYGSTVIITYNSNTYEVGDLIPVLSGTSQLTISIWPAAGGDPAIHDIELHKKEWDDRAVLTHLYLSGAEEINYHFLSDPNRREWDFTTDSETIWFQCEAAALMTISYGGDAIGEGEIEFYPGEDGGRDTYSSFDGPLTLEAGNYDLVIEVESLSGKKEVYKVTINVT